MFMPFQFFSFLVSFVCSSVPTMLSLPGHVKFAKTCSNLVPDALILPLPAALSYPPGLDIQQLQVHIIDHKQNGPYVDNVTRLAGIAFHNRTGWLRCPRKT